MANPVLLIVGAKAFAHSKANAQEKIPLILLHNPTTLLLRADQGRIRREGQFVHFNISYRIK